MHSKKTDETLGRNVRIIREMRMLTQRNLASSLDMSLGQIRNLERGEAPVTIDGLRRIADALDTTPGRLLDGPWSHRMLDLSMLDEERATALEALHDIFARDAKSARDVPAGPRTATGKGRMTFTDGIDGDAQESEFGNATLTVIGDDAKAISIAVTPRLPPDMDVADAAAVESHVRRTMSPLMEAGWNVDVQYGAFQAADR